MFLSNCYFWQKWESYIHNIALSMQWKVVLSESGEKNVQISQYLQVQTVQNSSKRSCFNVRGQQETNISLEETLLWIMDSCLKSPNHGFITNMQLFTSHNINWWTGVVWITCWFLWCFYQLDSHSDGTHSLHMIHWWANDGKISTIIWDGPEGKYIFSKCIFVGELFL